jgi:hypothetical protein
MSLFKEITESHDTVKAIAIILFLIPFWYVAIFLFNNEFYKSSDNLIILAMCIVISMISAVLFSIFVHNIYEAKNENKTILEHMGVCVAVLIIWLSILIFSFYSLGFLLNIYIYFYWFLVIYFAPLILFNFQQKVFGKSINKS